MNILARFCVTLHSIRYIFYEHYHLGIKVVFVVINLRAQYYLTLKVEGHQSNVKRFGSYLKENTK